MIDTLTTVIDQIDSKLHEKYQPESAQLDIYGRMTKLIEEVGELATEVLASNGHQSDRKLKEYSREKLSLEFADVIITTLLLAKSLNVDVSEGLAKKLTTIKERFQIIDAA